MSEKELNEQYIRNKIGGICQDCMWLDKIVPIIREMLSKAYIDGLEQSRFDKRMLEIQVSSREEVANKYKEVIEEVRERSKLERKTALSLNQHYAVSIIDSVLQILDKVKHE